MLSISLAGFLDDWWHEFCGSSNQSPTLFAVKRCAYKKADGKSCVREAVSGSNYCPWHNKKQPISIR